MANLNIIKLADKSGDPPASGPWPLLGVIAKGEVPAKLRISTKKVREGIREGWIIAENAKLVERSSGPPEAPWDRHHTFLQADSLTFKFVDVNYKYEVVGQPDKYPDTKEGDAGLGGEVRHYFDLELVTTDA